MLPSAVFSFDLIPSSIGLLGRDAKAHPVVVVVVVGPLPGHDHLAALVIGVEVGGGQGADVGGGGGCGTGIAVSEANVTEDGTADLKSVHTRAFCRGPMVLGQRRRE